MKKCSRCHEEKEKKEFFKQKNGKYGIAAECKKCTYYSKKLRAQGKDARIKNKLKREYVSRSKGHINKKNGYVYLSIKNHHMVKLRLFILLKNNYNNKVNKSTKSLNKLISLRKTLFDI